MNCFTVFKTYVKQENYEQRAFLAAIVNTIAKTSNQKYPNRDGRLRVVHYNNHLAVREKKSGKCNVCRYYTHFKCQQCGVYLHQYSKGGQTCWLFACKKNK